LGATTSKGFTSGQLYSTTTYQTGDLTRVELPSNNLSNWNFAGLNLTDASFDHSTLTGTDFSGATIAGAGFSETTFEGLTAEQIYATASYQNHELPGIGLDRNNLTGWNFSGQNLAGSFFYESNLTNANLEGANLSHARFSNTTLTNANLSNADVHGADLSNTTGRGFTATQLLATASYQAKDLSGIFLRSNNLSGWDFVGIDLTSATFSNSILAGTDFTDAVIRGADFGTTTNTGFTAEQLYSTASYQQRDLFGVKLFGNNLAGWNFVGQNVTNGYFARTTLTGADFTGADTRGVSSHNFGDVIDTNLIRPDGMIVGLDLTANQALVIRDYDGFEDPFNPLDPVAVTIQDHLSMDATSILELHFEADHWDSVISFEERIAVDLDGTLKLDFAADVNLTNQLGRTLKLFDWTGVTPNGLFAIESPYVWDLSELYTTGEVTLAEIPALPGDYDFDGDVDGRDLLAWQRGESPNPFSASDRAAWQANYGDSVSALAGVVSIPEPSAFSLALVAGLWAVNSSRKRRP
jgi:uncharacterized protein YjbI with pentapeptide repeats